MRITPIIFLLFSIVLFTSGCGLKLKKLESREEVEKDEVTELMEAGNLHFKQEQFTDALSKFLQARSIDANRKLLNYNIGASYFALERYADAAKSFTDELLINNQDAFAYIFRGHSYAMMGLNDKAEADLTLAMQLSDHAMAYYVQGLVFLNKGNFEMAVNKFNAAIHKEPADYLFYRDRGKALSIMGKTEKACADFLQAKRIRPSLDLSSEMKECE